MHVRPVCKSRPIPWNKGLLVGQKKPLQPSTFGRFAFDWRSPRCGEIFPCSIWRSIANFARVIWSNCVSTKYVLALGSEFERRSFKRRQADPYNSRLRSRQGLPWRSGYDRSGRPALDISSPADCMQTLTYPPDNILDWCTAGLIASVWNHDRSWHVSDLMLSPSDVCASGQADVAQDRAQVQK